MSIHPDIQAVLDGESEGCIIQGDCLEVMADMPEGCWDEIGLGVCYSSQAAAEAAKEKR
jgi:hypothetical protein